MTEIICIVCPRGCKLKVSENFEVTGNACKRGLKYGFDEVTAPTRMLTSSVKITNAKIARLPIRTTNSIPKNKILEVMIELRKVIVQAPVKVSDVIIENILNLGVDIIATRNLDKK